MNGAIVALDDEPGGGHHLDLILAGALGITIEDAEERKRQGDEDYSPILRPGVERIASSIARQIGDIQSDPFTLSAALSASRMRRSLCRVHRNSKPGHIRIRNS